MQPSIEEVEQIATRRLLSNYIEDYPGGAAIDTILGPGAKEHENLRAFLTAGHRRESISYRCVVKGKTIELEEFPAFWAVAVAGLGNLPDFILTR